LKKVEKKKSQATTAEELSEVCGGRLWRLFFASDSRRRALLVHCCSETGPIQNFLFFGFTPASTGKTTLHG
jgi:hypothetical protein